MCPSFSRTVGAAVLIGQLYLHAAAQGLPPRAAPNDGFVRLGQLTDAVQLPAGVEVRSGSAAMRIEALRDDLLRVRVTPDGVWQEDASWAVLPERRMARVSVSPITTSTSVGFTTKDLRVSVEKASLRLTVTDLQGNVICADAPNNPAQFSGPRDTQGGAFRVWKTLREDEHFFGLGDKTGPLDRRNEAFEDWNTDAFLFQESTDPIYKSIPFFLAESAGRYYGTYLDNTWRTSFDFGKALPDAYSFGSDGGPLDYYVLYGPDPKKVVQDYAWLTGPSPLPPLWSLGYQQSRYSYAPENKLTEVADRLRKDKIPTDVLWLDIDFQDRNRPFTFDPVGFAQMPQILGKLKAEHFHVVAITDLHVAKTPAGEYAPYDTGLAGDRFVKNADGSNYVGESWPGNVVFPDFTQKAAREWWGTNYKDFLHMGLSGFWNDMNEPSIRNEISGTMPLSTVHRIDGTGFSPRQASHREVHNIFGAQNARATYEGVLKLDPNERPYVMTRAAFAGAQRYSVTWTGDNSSTWNHLRMTTSMLENLGLSGFAFAGADVGGHVGSPDPDLLTKWLEIAAFQPIDRNHAAKSSNPQEVWVNGPAREDIARKFIELRYRLLPYSYTLAEETSRTGLPMLRPLFLEFPDVTPDRHPIDLDSRGEFMWGSDFLIALPAFLEMANKYSPTLPGDSWYDFWTGAKVPKGRPLSAIASDATEFSPSTDVHLTRQTEGERRRAAQNVPGLRITPSIDELPVYVRGGSIIPLQPVVQSSEEIPNGPLELRIYPGTGCKGSLYSDDGHSFNYQRGEYLRIAYTCEVTGDGLEIKIGAQQGSYPAWWKQIEVVVYGADAAPKAATRNGARVETTHNNVDRTTHFMIPQDNAGCILRLTL